MSLCSAACTSSAGWTCCPNEGKGSGAFSTGAPGTHPFLFISYDDTLENVSTLAHELGHSMHSYFTWQTQPPVYAQLLDVRRRDGLELQPGAGARPPAGDRATIRDFQLAVIDEAMSNFHRYFFIMPMLARFELECHERVEQGEGLTADAMSAQDGRPVPRGLRRRGGDGRRPRGHHLGRSSRTCSATSTSTSTPPASRRRTRWPTACWRRAQPAAERYLSFLKAGNSLYPLDALKLAGIDMTTPEPVERAFGVLTRLVDRLDELVGNGPLQKS